MKTLRFHFFLRKDRINSSEECPIFANVTVEKKLPISTGIFVSAQKWDQEKQRLKGNNPLVKAQNERLEFFKSKMYMEFNSLHSASNNFSTKELLDKFRGKREVEHTLMEAMASTIQMKKTEFENGDLDRTTYKKYCNSKSLLLTFLKEGIKKEGILLKDLKSHVIKDFELFLSSKYKSPGYVNKIIQQVRAAIKYAIERGWMSNDPFISHKYKPIPRKIEYLLPEEVKTIETTPILNVSLNQTKEVFLFICYTGLSYIDLKRLNYDNIQVNKDGKKFILNNPRVKTNESGRPYTIPLLDEAVDILNKYKESPELEGTNLCLPVIENATLNRSLKQLGTYLGLKRILLTTKVGRKTFGTIMLNKGISIESVSHMMGHRKIQTTQNYYAELLKDRIFEEMEEVRQKTDEKKKDKQGVIPA